MKHCLPYEEWLAVLAFGQSRFPECTKNVLKTLAREHFDDGVRFNAVRLLDDAGHLDAAYIEELLHNEGDADTRELLCNLRNQ